jgi:hypothetical protein
MSIPEIVKLLLTVPQIHDADSSDYDCITIYNFNDLELLDITGAKMLDGHGNEYNNEFASSGTKMVAGLDKSIQPTIAILGGNDTFGIKWCTNCINTPSHGIVGVLISKFITWTAEGGWDLTIPHSKKVVPARLWIDSGSNNIKIKYFLNNIPKENTIPIDFSPAFSTPTNTGKIMVSVTGILGLVVNQLMDHNTLGFDTEQKCRDDLSTKIQSPSPSPSSPPSPSPSSPPRKKIRDIQFILIVLVVIIAVALVSRPHRKYGGGYYVSYKPSYKAS